MIKTMRNLAGVLALPIALFIIFMMISDGFGIHSLPILISQSMIPVVLGLAMACTMEAGLFDLSVGVRVVLASTIGALLEPSLGFTGLVVGCLLGGILGGVVLAALYRLLRISSLVISIGIVLVYEIIAAKMAGTSGFLRISAASASIGSYPQNMLITFAACIIFYLLLYNTKTGSLIKTVGNDEAMALNMGIRTGRIKVMAYIISGLFCGITAILQICYSGAITIQTNMSTLTMVFQPMIGVLIGMQLLRLIDNMPLLVFVGELSISIIFNGFIAMGLTDKVQKIVLGIFLIAIMALSANTNSLKRMNIISKPKLATSAKT